MRRGFTLLEMMVATVVMAIAVVGLLSGISTSMRNAGRLTDYDRGVLLARSKMGELLLDRNLKLESETTGVFDRSMTGGVAGGWRARMTPFEVPPGASANTFILERVELEVWWMAGADRRTFKLDGYRQAILTPEEAAAL